MADKQTWNERYAGRELVWSAGPNKLFAEVVGSIERGTALDLACGEGRNAIYLAEEGFDVTGVDFSSTGIEKARAIAEHRGVNVHWIVADVLEVALPARSFDLVSVLYLHTDSASRHTWLPKAIEAVAPGGSFVYIGHDPRNIDEGTGGPSDPDVLPDTAELSAALGGFEILRAEVYRRPVTHDPGHGGSGDGEALDTLVYARRNR